MLEIDLDDDCFDEELVTYINTCFITLKQVGAIDYDFYVTDKTTSWSDLLKDKTSSFQSVKHTYMLVLKYCSTLRLHRPYRHMKI